MAEASSRSSLVGFASWMLGHANLEDQVLAYTSLVLDPAPKLELFGLFKPTKKSHTEELKSRAVCFFLLLRCLNFFFFPLSQKNPPKTKVNHAR
jgi:hypothetical protein